MVCVLNAGFCSSSSALCFLCDPLNAPHIVPPALPLFPYNTLSTSPHNFPPALHNHCLALLLWSFALMSSVEGDSKNLPLTRFQNTHPSPPHTSQESTSVSHCRVKMVIAPLKDCRIRPRLSCGVSQQQLPIWVRASAPLLKRGWPAFACGFPFCVRARVCVILANLAARAQVAQWLPNCQWSCELPLSGTALKALISPFSTAPGRQGARGKTEQKATGGKRRKINNRVQQSRKLECTEERRGLRTPWEGGRKKGNRSVYGRFAFVRVETKINDMSLSLSLLPARRCLWCTKTWVYGEGLIRQQQQQQHSASQSAILNASGCVRETACVHERLCIWQRGVYCTPGAFFYISCRPAADQINTNWYLSWDTSAAGQIDSIRPSSSVRTCHSQTNCVC